MEAKMGNPDSARVGWQLVRNHDSIQLQGKQYRHMTEWSRPCSICSVSFSIFEKTGAIDANSRFGNKTCDAHRGLIPAIEKGVLAWDSGAKCIIPGPALGGVNLAELQQLRMINKCMKEELEGLYADLQEYTQKFGKLGVKKAGPW
jgi:hypothetical protein